MKKYRYLFLLVLFILGCTVQFSACKETLLDNPIFYTLSYGIEGEGDLLGNTDQIVEEGGRGTRIEAVAAEGWHFVRWSDGYSSSVRFDKKVGKSLTVNAIFEPIMCNLNFVAQEGGRIEGELSQSVRYGEDGSRVMAIPDEGYRFIGWSDGFSFSVRSDKKVTKSLTVYAIFEPIMFNLNFVAQEGGRIEGEQSQSVRYGEDGSKVIAIPDEGYRFIGWSDGETEAVRLNQNVTYQSEEPIYAEFELYSRLFCYQYQYNDIDSNHSNDTVLLTLDNLDSVKLIVPIQEGYCFMGWYSDLYYNVQVSDELGNIIVDEEWLQGTWWYYDSFFNHRDLLYAQWEPEPKNWCHLQFDVREGGRIEGNISQWVLYGEDGTPVTAIPDRGYRFIRWSDGETEAVRLNLNVTYKSEETIYAEFERYFTRVFTYHYNEATSNDTEETVLITLDNLESVRLAVPVRDGYRFKGWYSDWHHTLQVSDESGKILLDGEWLVGEWWYDTQVNPENNLYAKWEAIQEVPTYKILMIFVTEVHGNFERSSSSSVKEVITVDYVMSDIERRICIAIAERMETYLEAILNATVNFEVDTYFTKEPLTRENFYRGSTVLPGAEVMSDTYGINLRDHGIPEVDDILGNYRSVMTTFSLNDAAHKLVVVGGTAGAKYGEVSFDAILPPDPERVPYKTAFFDYQYPGVFEGWALKMSFYIHEFIHTVELQLNAEDRYGLHRANAYKQLLSPHGFEIMIPYLKNEFESEKGLVGIPYSFWDGTYVFEDDYWNKQTPLSIQSNLKFVIPNFRKEHI